MNLPKSDLYSALRTIYKSIEISGFTKYKAVIYSKAGKP